MSIRKIPAGIFVFLLWAVTTGAATAAFIAAVRGYGTARLWNLLIVLAVFMHALWLLRWRGLVLIAIGMIVGGAYGLASIYGYNFFAPGFYYLLKSRAGWEAHKIFGVLPAQIPVFWSAYAYLGFLISEFIAVRWTAAPGWKRDLAAAGVAGACMASLLLLIDPVCVARKVWLWHPAGSYFTMPVSNLFGWFFAGAAAVLLYRVLFHRTCGSRLASVDAPLALALYLSFLALIPALSELSAAFYVIAPLAILVPVAVSLYAYLSGRPGRISENVQSAPESAVTARKND
ncbi:MAG: carotenoid biosynthesis protein [Planctomycetota bacterium]|jgi:uncharacterized membrane protein